jgi:hypothetical protein
MMEAILAEIRPAPSSALAALARYQADRVQEATKPIRSIAIESKSQ